MTYAQVRRQLANVTYSDAVKRYSEMKERFLEDYERALKNQSGISATQLMDDFASDINSSNFQGQSFAVVNRIVDRIGQGMASALAGQDLSEFDSLKADSEKSYNDLTNKQKKALTDYWQSIYNIQELHNILQENLRFLKVRNNQRGLNSTDIITWMKSYCNQILYAKIRATKVSPQRAQLAGYIEEALVHKATVKLTDHLKNKSSSLQVGSMKIKNSDGKKIDTIFDEYFNFFSTNLSQTFSASVVIDTNSLTAGYGAQVKLRNLPWRLKVPNGKHFPIGNNKSLYGAWEEKKSWIKGVWFLENKVHQAMGDNVFYVAGNSFIWTADLISEARANEYYLAFTNNGRSFTGAIHWEPIDMSKPFKE